MAYAASVVALKTLLEGMTVNLNRAGHLDCLLYPLVAVRVTTLGGVDYPIINCFLESLEGPILGNIIPSEISQKLGQVEMCALPVEMFFQRGGILQVGSRAERLRQMVPISLKQLLDVA